MERLVFSLTLALDPSPSPGSKTQNLAKYVIHAMSRHSERQLTPAPVAPLIKIADPTKSDRKQRASESSPAARADQLPQGLAQTWTRQQSPIDICGELIQAFAQKKPRDALDDNRLEDAAASDRSIKRPPRQTQRNMCREKKPRSDRTRSRQTRKTSRNRRKQKKPRRSASSSTWRSGDADASSGWWEEFWGSDSD